MSIDVLGAFHTLSDSVQRHRLLKDWPKPKLRYGMWFRAKMSSTWTYNAWASSHCPFFLPVAFPFLVRSRRARQRRLLLVLRCLKLVDLLPTTSLASPWPALALPLLPLLASFLVLSHSSSLLHKALSRLVLHRLLSHCSPCFLGVPSQWPLLSQASLSYIFTFLSSLLHNGKFSHTSA